MKTIVKILVSALILSFSVTLYAQENSALYFSSMPQAANYNPAFLTHNRMYVNLIGRFAFDFHTSGFAYGDLVNKVPGSDSLRIDFEGFLKQLKSHNSLSLSTNNDLLGFGFKVKENYFSFSMTLNTEVKTGFSKNLFDFLVHGTGMSSNTVSLFNDNLLDATVYLTTAFGYAREINDQLTIGAKFKIYNGVANIRSKKTSVNLEFDEEEIRAYADVDIRAAIPFGEVAQAGSLFDDDEDFKFEKDGSVMDGLKRIKNNRGFGMDVGATYKLNEKMTFSASLVDIGRIKWKTHATNIRSKNPKQEVVFSGLSTTYNTIDDDIDDFIDDMTDSLKNAFDLEVNSLTGYSTGVPMKIYLGYSWEFSKYLFLQALYSGRMINGGMENALTVNFTFDPGFVQLSVGNTIRSKFFNPDIYIGLGNKFYLGLSYNSSLNLAKTNGITAYLGFNILALKNKQQKRTVNRVD